MTVLDLGLGVLGELLLYLDGHVSHFNWEFFDFRLLNSQRDAIHLIPRNTPWSLFMQKTLVRQLGQVTEGSFRRRIEG
jgi:hypothetical protein